MSFRNNSISDTENVLELPFSRTALSQEQKVASFPGKPSGKSSNPSVNHAAQGWAEDVVDHFDPLADKLDLNFIDDEDYVDGLLRRPSSDLKTGTKSLNSNIASNTENGTPNDVKESDMSRVRKNGVPAIAKPEENALKQAKDIKPDRTLEELVQSIGDRLYNIGDELDIRQAAVSKINKPDINVITSSPKTSPSLEGPKNQCVYESAIEETDLISALESPVKVSKDHLS